MVQYAMTCQVAAASSGRLTEHVSGAGSTTASNWTLSLFFTEVERNAVAKQRLESRHFTGFARRFAAACRIYELQPVPLDLPVRGGSLIEECSKPTRLSCPRETLRDDGSVNSRNDRAQTGEV